MTDADSPEEVDSTEIFLGLLTEHEPAIKVYVIAMIPAIADAEDIMQDTRLAMWKNFSSFTVGTNFRAWGRKVAYNRIMAFRKRKAIESKRLVFTDAFYDAVDSAAGDLKLDVNERRTQLLSCVGKLQESHQRIVILRYKERMSIEQIGETMGRTVTATYRVLSRIRAGLRKCVTLQEGLS